MPSLQSGGISAAGYAWVFFGKAAQALQSAQLPGGTLVG